MPNKIQLIKEVRNLTKCSLRESVELVNGFLDGQMPEKKDLMERAEKLVAKRVPRSEQYRQIIRRRIAGIKNLMDELISTVEGDFGSNELPEIRESLEKIVDESLVIKDTMTYSFEEALYADTNVKL